MDGVIWEARKIVRQFTIWHGRGDSDKLEKLAHLLSKAGSTTKRRVVRALESMSEIYFIQSQSIKHEWSKWR